MRIVGTDHDEMTGLQQYLFIIDKVMAAAILYPEDLGIVMAMHGQVLSGMDLGPGQEEFFTAFDEIAEMELFDLHIYEWTTGPLGEGPILDPGAGYASISSPAKLATGHE
jgi:hypothetical protein